ncbi:MAG: LAO/AO transport system kinase [Halioglobus sp.]
MPDIDQLITRALGGERQAIARLLSVIERADKHLLPIENQLTSRLGNAFVIGITGPPGAGKSTLINRLIPHVLDDFGSAAVLAVDPSSPFTHGALLGDRVRMQGGEFAEKVFIRSMASRGEAGGLARAAATSVRLFDACKWPVVIIETLGIGQVELEIMNLADTVLVVLNPDWGDEIQANKAGLTEAGDVFAINKADKPGAMQTRVDLLDSVSLIPSRPVPDIVSTVAINDEGVKDLWLALKAHQTELADSGELERRRERRQRGIIGDIIKAQLLSKMDDTLNSAESSLLFREIACGDIDLSEAVERVMSEMVKFDSTHR